MLLRPWPRRCVLTLQQHAAVDSMSREVSQLAATRAGDDHLLLAKSCRPLPVDAAEPRQRGLPRKLQHAQPLRRSSAFGLACRAQYNSRAPSDWLEAV